MSKFSFSNLPRIHFLSSESIRVIHEASISLLEKIGVLVQSKDVLKLLRDAGCEVNARGRVKIPEHLVNECIKSAPSSVRIYSRDGKHDLNVEGDNVYFNPGSAAISILDFETESIRPPTVRDLLNLVIVTDYLNNIHAQSTALVPSDVPEEVKDRVRLYIALKYSTKPVITGAFTIDGLHDMKKMLDIVAGYDSSRKPMAVFDVCPSPPLKWSELTVTNLVDCARYRIPAELVSMPQIGATGPATLAGCLIQHTAENLSGIVIHQLTSRGAPIIYGGSPALLDMRSGMSCMATPEVMLLISGYVEIGKYYGLPTHGYLGLSDTKTVDYQAGLESSMGILIGALKGVNIVSGAGMMDFESCQSLEKLVLDNEICGYALRIVKGINVTEETLAINVFNEAIEKGGFISLKHTMKWFKSEQYFPAKLIDRDSRRKWMDKGSKNAWRRAKEEVERILKEHKPQSLSNDIERELNEFTKSVMKRYGAKLIF
ncbi:MAG: trimethylamine methyltransferase family protein [Candidatus Methanomethylicia archaeon]